MLLFHRFPEYATFTVAERSADWFLPEPFLLGPFSGPQLKAQLAKRSGQGPRGAQRAPPELVEMCGAKCRVSAELKFTKLYDWTQTIRTTNIGRKIIKPKIYHRSEDPLNEGVLVPWFVHLEELAFGTDKLHTLRQPGCSIEGTHP